MTQLPMLNTAETGPAERGRIHVHFGDWREQEPDWPRPFVFVSDVPYGIDDQGGRVGKLKGRTIAGDKTTDERDAAMEVEGWQAAAIFGPAEVLDTPPWGTPRCLLILNKGDHVGMGDCRFPWKPNYETVAIYGQGWKGHRGSSVLRGEAIVSWSGRPDGRKHSHQKPVQVMSELVAKAPPGLPIVDPFMGSGTTAVACALLGREFWGAEIDPQYFDVIRGRLAAVGVVIPGSR